jgi:hypothetical protein
MSNQQQLKTHQRRLSLATEDINNVETVLQKTKFI